MSSNRYIRIFDTTLRDGEQAPGATLNRAEKLEIAHQLAKLRVDIIEAGFPIASPDDFEAVKAIATEVKGPRIAGLARAIEEDIRVCWDAVKVADVPRIHTFISTSAVHMKYQIKKTPDEVLADTRAMVSLSARPGRHAPRGRPRVQRHGREPLRPRVPGAGARPRRAVRRDHHQRARHGGLRAAARVRRLHPRAVPAGALAARRARERALPQRPRAGHGQLAGRGARRRHAGRVRRQRHRRARRQRLARRGGHGDPHARRVLRQRDRRGHQGDRPHQPPGELADRLRRSSATRRSSGATRSRTRAASTRPACSARRPRSRS